MKGRVAPYNLALVACGLLFGAVSLAYPFGWDSGVNYYVGREWLLRGALPYRDLFDHKTPGIYVVHALSVAFLGDSMVGIRVAELACVVTLGLLCSAAVTPRGGKPLPGLRGAGVLAASVFYYGFFDFWNTAQCEIWSVTLVMGALVATQRARDTRVAATVSGLLLGAAFVMKPPSALLGLVGVALLARRVRGTGSRAIFGVAARHLAGLLALPALVIVYFAVHGALGIFVDVVVDANWYYLHHDPPHFDAARAAGRAVGAWRDFSPVAPVVLVTALASVAWSLTRRTQAWRPYALAGALLVGCIASVTWQRKFYLYHWGIAVAPLTMMIVSLVQDGAGALDGRVPWARRLVPAVSLAGLMALWTATGAQFEGWVRSTYNTALWLRGDINRAQFTRTFSEYFFQYQYADREEVGLWLRAHASPDDRLLVRSVAAEIYVVSGLRAPADRFFWSTWLTLPSRAYRREEWLREDRVALESDLPRWAVVLGHVEEGPDSVAWFRPYGYVVRTQVNDLVVLERAESRASR